MDVVQGLVLFTINLFYTGYCVNLILKGLERVESQLEAKSKKKKRA